MILLIDCDSLVFASCLVSKKENREEKHYTDIEDSIAKFEEQYFKIVNDLEEDYEIDKIYNFNYSQGNFRKLITKKYKANIYEPRSRKTLNSDTTSYLGKSTLNRDVTIS